MKYSYLHSILSKTLRPEKNTSLNFADPNYELVYYFASFDTIFQYFHINKQVLTEKKVKQIFPTNPTEIFCFNQIPRILYCRPKI